MSSNNWFSEVEEPVPAPLSALGWVLAAVRLGLLAIVIYGPMIPLVLVRLLETPLKSHPVSPFIVQIACKWSLWVLGFSFRIHGRPMRQKGAIVSNHASWLDIFSLNAAARVFFVSKAEVRNWPAIGMIARTTGTVFIERKASEARRQKTQFEERLIRGDRLLFFPEGTSTDSRRVIPFKSTLFAAFFEPHLADEMWIQPVSLIYRAPKGRDARFYGWWGDMEFGPHFLSVLGALRNGRVEVVFHAPVRVADFKDRKALAHYCEVQTRAGLERAIGPV